MDVGRAFSFITEDEDWLKKVLIAGLIGLIPIFGQYVQLGWAMEILRRVARQEAEPLASPTEDFIQYLIKGFLANIIVFVYLLPTILLIVCIATLPIALEGSTGSGNDELLATIFVVLNVCFSCLIGIYSIFAGLMSMAGIGNYATSGEFASALRFGEVFGYIRGAIGAYIIAVLVSFLVILLAELIGLLLCGIGIFFTLAYAFAVNAHLAAQAFEQGRAKALAPA